MSDQQRRPFINGQAIEETTGSRTQVSQSACGICVVATRRSSPAEAVVELKQKLSHCDIQHMIVFFSATLDAHAVSAELAAAFPDIELSGCSTAGEISALGITQGGMVAIAFPRQGFRVCADKIENVRQSGVEGACETARELLMKLRNGRKYGSSSNAFAILLIDGLSNYEEMIVAAINWEIGDVQLIGGSAGDNLVFDRTVILHNTEVMSEGGKLILVETDVPFRVFKTQNFDPTDKKLVVTKADTENRIVYELNAEPAALEYADAIGLVPDDLGPFSFASYPPVVKVGGDYYCRSIRNMNDDGSLSFFCAIDEGLVFTVANPVDLVGSTDETLKEISRDLGGIDLVIGFDCILRKLDAENRQMRQRMEALYMNYGIAGFQTYGEQFNAMHLNQTLTGIAFGNGHAPNLSQT